MPFLIFFLFLFGCHQQQTQGFMGTEMTMPYRVVVGAPLSYNEKKEVESLIALTFEEVNRVYNNWNPDSELSALNRLKAGEKKKVSLQLQKMLELTDHVVKLTGGRFDPTVKSPKHMGWKAVHLNDSIFYKEYEDTTIDLGGIAKGYCVDLLTERLIKAGYPDIYVEWGGEIRAHGKHPEGRFWQVFISRFGDTDPANAMAFVPLDNCAIATSGNYLQYHFKNGKKLTHIIDPKNGDPLEVKLGSVSSVSIKAESCAIADGIATAAMLFQSVEKAEEWLSTIPGIEFWVYSQ